MNRIRTRHALNASALLVVLALAGALVHQVSVAYHLANDPITNNPGFKIVKNATLSVQVTENNVPAKGVLYIEGDCPQSPINSEAGSFNCHLTHTWLSAQAAGELSLTSLRYQSYITQKNYELDILPAGSPVTISQEGIVSLKVTINGDEDPIIQQWKNNELIDITGTGLQ
jgi:hypothetical protein